MSLVTNPPIGEGTPDAMLADTAAERRVTSRSPIRIAAICARRRSTSASATVSSTYRRDSAEHFWPPMP